MSNINLPRPKNQRQEVLFTLLNGGKYSRKYFMDHLWVMNVTAQIEVLRNKYFIPIEMERVHVSNKYGREVVYGKYHIKPEHIDYARAKYRALCAGELSPAK